MPPCGGRLRRSTTLGPTPANKQLHFFCLNVRTRQEFYWEHFGMLDDTDYLKTALQKLNILSENNLIPGKNLITTFETSDTPISASYVQKLIDEFLI